MTNPDNMRNYARVLTKDAYILSQAHFYRANYWGLAHLFLGIVSIICSVSAGASFLSESQVSLRILQFSMKYETLAGFLAFLSSIIIAILTFLKPNKHEQDHYNAATSFISLYYEARAFCEVVSKRETNDEKQLLRDLDDLIKEMNKVDKISPRIPDGAWHKAKRHSKEYFDNVPIT